MHAKGFLTLRAFLSSVFLHIVAGLLLFVSFEFEPKLTPPPPSPNKVIDAVTIDKKELELELKKLQDDDLAAKKKESKRQEELKKQTEIEKQKAKAAKNRRKAEEKKIAETKKKQEAEKKRLAELEKTKKLEREKTKKAIADRKKAEAEKEAAKKKLAEEKKKAEAEKEAAKKRLAEEKKKAEAEKEAAKKKLAEEKKKAEEKKRKEQEAALKAQLDAELEAEQAKQDLTQIGKYERAISQAIKDKFNIQALPKGLSCKIKIRMVEGGNVVEAIVIESSGNELFNRRATSATYAASPLPVPDELRLFKQMQTLTLNFRP